MAITNIIAIINSGIALKKIVIVLAIKKIKKFGAKFLAENNAIGIEITIAKNVPKMAISIVSSILKNKLSKFEKSGGIIRPRISAKYFEELENNFIKLIFKSIVIKAKIAIVTTIRA
jgi:hypothetical protein